MSEKLHTDTHIAWHVELLIRPGKIADFKQLTQEMVSSTRTESGVLNFERFVSDDESIVHIYERYIDSQSAIIHLNTFKQKFGQRFSDVVERKRFVVWGSPNRELAQILENFGARFFKKLDGFSAEY